MDPDLSTAPESVAGDGGLLDAIAEPLRQVGGEVARFVTDPAWFVPLLQALVLLAIGYVAARLARLAIGRGITTLNEQQRILAQRTAYWGIMALFAVSAMRELGFDFGVVLGAAGIVTVALGFASQTSASNLISGLFLVLERAIESGDVIRVDGYTGQVLSVDLLSTQLRTFDNLLVRIPSETMVKTQITNLNRLPIRRVDLQVGVGYGSDLGEALRLLREAAHAEPLILEEPKPIVIAQGFGDSSINYQFSVWTETKNYLEVRNVLQHAVKRYFDEGGIEIPFPQRTLTGGGPIELRFVDGGAPAASLPQRSSDGDPATTQRDDVPATERPADAARLDDAADRTGRSHG